MRSSQREVLPMWHQQMWCSTVEVHDECVYNSVYVDCRCCAVSAAHGGRAEQGSELPWLGHPPAQLLVLLWLFCGVLCQAARLHLLLQVTPVPSLLSFPRPHSGEVGQSLTTGPVPCPALPCPALPCPALPCPALPCPALPCPALPCPAMPCPAPPWPTLPLLLTASFWTNTHCIVLLHSIKPAVLFCPLHQHQRHHSTFLTGATQHL